MFRPGSSNTLHYTPHMVAVFLLLTAATVMNGCDAIGELLREETRLLTTGDGDERALQLRAGDGQQTIRGVARVLHESNTFGPGCNGFIALEPTLRFELEEALIFRLALRSPIDTTLVIVGPGGPHCDDDTDGLDPVIESRWEPGLYRVFVGSYQPRSEPFEYEFLIGPRTTGLEDAERDGGASLTEVGPQPSMDPARLSAARIRSRAPRVLLPEERAAAEDAGAVSELPPARSFAVRGGGERAALDFGLHPECVGYFNESEATLTLERDSAEALRLSVDSQADSALVVRLPDGSVRCADDSEGFNPRVEIAAGEALGSYQIWVGGYHRGNFDAVLTVERGVW